MAVLTRTVDVHVDGLLVALRLQEQQLRNNQAGDAVVDLQGSGEGGCAQLEGKEQANPGNCEVAGEQGWVSEPKEDRWGGLSTREGRW